MASNLQAIKERGVYVTTLEGRGYIYMLNNRMFLIGKDGFIEM